MATERYRIVRHKKAVGIHCEICGRTSYDWRAAMNRYCPHCEEYLETPFQRNWRRFKEKPEYQRSAFPFPPRKVSVFEKIWSGIHGLLMVVGVIWLFIILVGSMF